MHPFCEALNGFTYEEVSLGFRLLTIIPILVFFAFMAWRIYRFKKSQSNN